MFCIVGFAVGILSEARNKAENELKDYSERLEEKVEERTRELKESEERFQDIALSSADWIWEGDKNGRYTFASGKVKQILGYVPEEIIGKTPFELMPKEEAERISEIFKKISSEKKPIVDLENWNLTKEGEKICLLTNGVPILNEKGELLGYRGVDKDITERKKAEKALRESEERFRAISETAQDSIFIKDRTLKYTQVNPAMEKLFGVPASKLIGKTDDDLFDKVAASHIREIDSRVLKGEIVEEEHTKKVKGIPFTFHIIKVPMRNASGEIIGLCGIARDITERKRAEKELRESKNEIEHLHKIATQMESTQSEEEVYQLTVDTAEKILQFNICEVYMVEEDKLVVKAVSSDMPLAGGQDMSIEEGIAGKTYRTSESYLTEDIKEEKEARHSIDEYRSGISIPIGKFGVFQAISTKIGAFDQEDLKMAELLISHTIEALKRIRSEKALQESEEKYRSLTNQLPVGIYRTTNEGKFLHANPALATILEFESVEDFMKVSASDVYNDPRERINQIKQWKTTREIISNELKFRTKKGREIWIRDTGHVILDENGEISYIDGVIEDITNRKKMEETLQKEKERYRILAEESPLGVSIIGKDGHYKYINPKFVEIFGYTLEDIPTGKEWFAKAYPDQKYRNQAISTWITDLKKSEHDEVRPRTFIVRCKDDSEKVIHFRPITTEIGDQFVIYEDITERKKAEKLLKKQREELSAFAHTVSHDLKNYIGIIRNSAQFSLLKKEYAEKNNQRIIDMTKKMENFVNRQLELADAGKAIGELEEIDLNKMIDEVRKTYSIEIHTEELSMIKGDSQRLKEVFHNLIDNAIKHGKADKIEISSIKKEDSCIICVKDNGKGISEEDIDNIFNRGYSKTGTGFGLTIVKKIIEAHNGSISVKSKEGKGTTFEIVLPI